MAQEECETCRFFRKLFQDEQVGECRRFPPKLYSEGIEFPEGWTLYDRLHADTWFPVVDDCTWCGEYRRRLIK